MPLTVKIYFDSIPVKAIYCIQSYAVGYPTYERIVCVP